MANRRKPEDKKRQGIYVKLPPAIIKFLRDQEKSQANTIIDALKKSYKELRAIE